MKIDCSPVRHTVYAETTAQPGPGAQRTGQAVTAALGSPRAVTRGESFPGKAHTGAEQIAKVDWLNATFDAPDRYMPSQFVDMIGKVIGRELFGIDSHGMFGFDQSVKLHVRIGSRSYPIGCFAWGGESQKGRMMFQLTGAGCGVVKSWSRLQRFLAVLHARITRLDLCVDYLDGEYSVDDAVAMYERGEFNGGGRRPSSSVAGDWINKELGRTLYVGKGVNGKVLRVYEKGRQLGNIDSEWVRFEVQLGNRDRVIPLHALTRRDAILAGCYPALEQMLKEAAERIRTTRTEGATTVAHLMFHLKRSYGRLLSVLSDTDASAGELIEGLTIVGAPRRLKPGFSVSSLSWGQLLSQIKKR